MGGQTGTSVKRAFSVPEIHVSVCKTLTDIPRLEVNEAIGCAALHSTLTLPLPFIGHPHSLFFSFCDIACRMPDQCSYQVMMPHHLHGTLWK